MAGTVPAAPASACSPAASRRQGVHTSSGVHGAARPGNTGLVLSRTARIVASRQWRSSSNAATLAPPLLSEAVSKEPHRLHWEPHDDEGAAQLLQPQRHAPSSTRRNGTHPQAQQQHQPEEEGPQRLAQELQVPLHTVQGLLARCPHLLNAAGVATRLQQRQRLVQQLGRLQQALGLDMAQAVRMVAKQPALLTCPAYTLVAQVQSLAAALTPPPLPPSSSARDAPATPPPPSTAPTAMWRLALSLVALQPELLEVPPPHLLSRALALAATLQLDGDDLALPIVGDHNELPAAAADGPQPSAPLLPRGRPQRSRGPQHSPEASILRGGRGRLPGSDEALEAWWWGQGEPREGLEGWAPPPAVAQLQSAQRASKRQQQLREQEGAPRHSTPQAAAAAAAPATRTAWLQPHVISPPRHQPVPADEPPRHVEEEQAAEGLLDPEAEAAKAQQRRQQQVQLQQQRLRLAVAGLRLLSRLPSHDFYQLLSLPAGAAQQRLLALEHALGVGGTPAGTAALVAACPRLLAQPLRRTRAAWEALRRPGEGPLGGGLPAGRAAAWLARCPALLCLPAPQLLRGFRELRRELGWDYALACRRVAQQPSLLRLCAGGSGGSSTTEGHDGSEDAEAVELEEDGAGRRSAQQPLLPRLRAMAAALGVGLEAARGMAARVPSLLLQSPEGLAGKRRALAAVLLGTAAVDQEQGSDEEGQQQRQTVERAMVAAPVLLTCSASSLEAKAAHLAAALGLSRPRVRQLLAAEPRLLALSARGVARNLEALARQLGWTRARARDAAAAWPSLVTQPAGGATGALRELALLLRLPWGPEPLVVDEEEGGEKVSLPVHATGQELLTELATAWPELVAGRVGPGVVARALRALAARMRRRRHKQEEQEEQDGVAAAAAAEEELRWVVLAVRHATRKPHVLRAAVLRLATAPQPDS